MNDTVILTFTYPLIEPYFEDFLKSCETQTNKEFDIIIVNDEYSRYKGELHVILKDTPNDGRKNVIGHIPENEKMLLDYIKPWLSFGFIR